MSKDSARPLSELDPKSRENLERILGIDPVALAPSDRAFMKGRADYLTAEQKADYVDNQPEPEEESEDSYAKWTVAELREEVAARDLGVSSNAKKAELVAALEADDEKA